MISFNELKYSSDLKYLIIDISVDSDPYYDNVIIDSIIIDNQDTFTLDGPSSKPIFVQSYIYDSIFTEDFDRVLTKDLEECFVKSVTEERHIKVRLKIGSDLKVDTSKDILFVYVKAGGYPDPSTPCGLDNSLTLGVVVNLQCIYNDMMKYINELANKCSISDNLINTVLKWQAIETCINTENYLALIDLWKDFLFCNNSSCSLKSKCGCNGYS